MTPATAPSTAARHRRVRRAASVALCAGAALLMVSACADDPASVGADVAGSGDPPSASWPWAHQPGGAPLIADVPPQPSLEFPAGTGYGEALRSLFIASRQGALPAEAVMRDPLPAEVVYAEGTRDQGLRLSLTAPWGWVAPSGAIRAPSVSLPGTMSSADAIAAAEALAAGGPFPDDAAVDVPRLPECQVEPAQGERPPCG